MAYLSRDGLGFDNAQQNCPEGYEIVIADDYTLQIDYDRPDLPTNFYEMLSVLRQRAPGILRWYKLPSKSGNLHVTIKLPIEMDVTERIAWQAAFGSDSKREMLGLIRVSMRIENSVLFFEKKDLIPEPIEVSEEGRVFRSKE